ncbi:hypothetical protein TBR22_A17700 [Luteitalea sp. TBR-22]|nr:hypothetical protein TBR22_A17700 [Luteitalea sp. TBR-22]
MAAVLRALLGEVFDVVAEVADGEALLAHSTALAPDAIVCDIGLPRLSGLDAAERLLARDAHACIVLVTIDVDPSCVNRALAIGVRGYVAKPDAGEELVPAVLAALARRVYLSSSVRPAPPSRHP